MHDINALKELLKEPKEVLITTHHKPDADALGSSLGLAGYLKKKGHHVTVITPSDYPNFLNWMHGNSEVIVYSEHNDALVQRLIQESQMIFCLDFNTLSRINEMGEYIRQASGTKVLVDHHLQPENFADLSFSNTSAAATAEIVYDMIKAMGDADLIDTEIGECLYAGIMTDTGSFRHPSTSKNVHLIIADLLQIGVETSKIHRLIYDSSSELRLRFLGYALKEKLVVLPEYRTAYFAITADELKAYDSKTGDTEGLVNYALSIEGIVFAALIIDRTQAVKMSFRSVGDFSVNDFAREHFNGGGHKNAAGGMSIDTLENTVARFESLLPLYKDQLQHATDK
ncbi:DHH family phosphoesterase [Pontibacter chinhatensis]|uniref:Phosphoesterase RecJ domain-containing protein n=1 Tax=Pontibacter chinhatensis TaxID=1436961 RepID=A0A1I2VXU5_9BACT|nr:bifunctional oligoribonuclease/PAP phosphatase NrnA [Pontibacter chinhatensis]SFG93872.1 phosphoesterase RecJ domain-containing protein [Pontibacter chinhatensis]